MFEQITPIYKFTCDRCGREQLSGDEGVRVYRIKFEDKTDIFKTISKEGEVCEECHKDFVELSQNFFDEVNKNEGVTENE